VTTDVRTVVLVHGAWHGAWCWERVTPFLDTAGVPWRAIDLPLSSLADDMAALGVLLEQIGGPVLLVGHSYGGVVISGAGAHPAVERLVYVAAFAVTEDESAASAMPESPVQPTELGAFFAIDDDGFVTLEPAGAKACLYNRCSDGDAGAALDRLRPISMACFTNSPGVAAWRNVPSTYLLCLDDQGVPAALQRAMAERAGADIVEWDVDHSPFYSAPERTAELLASLARDEAG
jgi:pimeloyl-ACP methyl ester carboxylesterase